MGGGKQIKVEYTQLLLLSRKRRAQELENAEIRMDGQKRMRSKSKTVKCLGVLLDDGLTWKQQVQSVRKRCFAGLAKLRSDTRACM